MIVNPPVVYHVSAIEVRTLTNISDLQYISADGSLINCTVVFAEFPLEPMPFTADKFDSMAHGREIYNDIVAGKYGEIAPYEAANDPWSA